jgi:mitochondrial fission protein ELM1
MADRPIRIWAVSDGRAGMESQVLGLAEAVARLRPADVAIKHVAYRPEIRRLPSLLNLFPRHALGRASDRIEPPWPDLWIAAGRATLPLSIRVRSWSKGQTFVVQTQAPRWPAGLFDLVIPPRHDAVAGENVFPITGSPNRITDERLAAERARFAGLIDAVRAPRAAVLIGGRSRHYDITPGRAETLAAEIEAALEAAEAGLMLTFSRRTPPAAKAVLRARLERRPGVIWDGAGENPYFAFLAAADFIAVTEDSTNMATEAAGTGKPVFVLKVDGGSKRLSRLHQELEARGAARPFGGQFYGWSYPPLRETERAAEEVVRRLEARRGAVIAPPRSGRSP